jgi:hypothetical protein
VIKEEFDNVCDGKQFINLANEKCIVAGSRHLWCVVGAFWRWSVPAMDIRRACSYTPYRGGVATVVDTSKI